MNEIYALVVPPNKPKYDPRVSQVVNVQTFKLMFTTIYLKNANLTVHYITGTYFFSRRPEFTKGQIKPKAIWARHRFSQKTNEFVLFAVKSKKANKTNLLVCFLGESTARQSAFGFI